MKKIVTVSILSFCCFALFAQKKDSAVLQFIQKEGPFISLADSIQLLPVVKPFLENLSSYLTNTGIKCNDYYTAIAYIREDSNHIELPLWHYDGFVRQWKLMQNNQGAKGKSTTEIITPSLHGNASGRDGYIKFDKSTKQVVSFLKWQ